MKCRIDHYQTPEKVHVSVYAKKADKEKSRIIFNRDEVRIEWFLYLKLLCLTSFDSSGPS